MFYSRLILLFIATIFIVDAFACLNGETKILTNGWTLYIDNGSESDIPSGHNFFNTDELEKVVTNLDSLYKATKNIDYYSDKGLVLIILKRYNEAIKIYKEIENIAPNRYSTASNLGTAYELSGKNELALKWIKKSVVIDSSSHNQSEWIHVKILQTKLLGDTAINSFNLIGIDFGNEYELLNVGLNSKKLHKLASEIKFQLQERMSFVEPKDKIVAHLLMDLGNIYSLEKQYFKALEVYDKAAMYSDNNKVSELINLRKHSIYRQIKIDNELLESKKIKNILSNNNIEKSFNALMIICTIILIILILAIGLWIYKRSKNSQRI